MSRGKISKYVKWYLVLNCISFTTNVKISNEERVYSYISSINLLDIKINEMYFIVFLGIHIEKNIKTKYVVVTCL